MVSDGLRKESYGLGKVSDGLGKVSDGLCKVSDGLEKVSDCLWKVLDGSGREGKNYSVLFHPFQPNPTSVSVLFICPTS